MKRLSKAMETVAGFLRQPDAYIRERGDGKYEIGASGHRVLGLPVDPHVSKSTVAAMKKRGLLIFGRRRRYNRQQVGYFLAGGKDGQP